MADSIEYQLIERKLILSGSLTVTNLLPLWQLSTTIVQPISEVNISALTHIDSAGLALLLQFVGDSAKQGDTLIIKGCVDKLSTLMNVYNLEQILVANLVNSSNLK